MTAILLLSVAAHIFFFLLTPYSVSDDFPSYRSAAETIFNGMPDAARTPLYPILLALIRLLVPNEPGFTLLVTLVQTTLFLYTIPKFHAAAKQIAQACKDLELTCQPFLISGSFISEGQWGMPDESIPDYQWIVGTTAASDDIVILRSGNNLIED